MEEWGWGGDRVEIDSVGKSRAATLIWFTIKACVGFYSVAKDVKTYTKESSWFFFLHKIFFFPSTGSLSIAFTPQSPSYTYVEKVSLLKMTEAAWGRRVGWWRWGSREGGGTTTTKKKKKISTAAMRPSQLMT